jgi:hypothetical protein
MVLMMFGMVILGTILGKLSPPATLARKRPTTNG